MKKKISTLFLILLFLITSFLSIFLFSCISESDIKVSEPELKEKIIEEESDDIIRYFFELIDQGKTNEAVDLLDSSVAPDSNTKQQWKSAFDGFESAEVISKEPFNEQSWTDNYQVYKVTLNIQIKPERLQELINWNGQSIRWISIIKSGDTWKIGIIATSA
ncbi:MAG TPA: hypothetical protein VGB37_02685 [Candidatus Lokiarchaeia archaeon]